MSNCRFTIPAQTARFCFRSGYWVLLAALLSMVQVAHAGDGLADAPTLGEGEGQAGTLLANILDLINDILIPFLIAIGFLVFVWGMFQYFILGGANEESKQRGKSLAIYAVVAFVLIIIFWGLINLIVASTGLAIGEGDADDLLPQVNTFE